MYENLLANVPTDLWIGGQWRKASDGKRFDVIDPATENTVASVASATVDDAKAAVDAASAAFPAWAAKKPRERGEILRKAFDLIMRDAERLAKLITLENGKALPDSRGEVAYAAEFFRWNAEEAVRNLGQLYNAPSSGARVVVQHKPAGVAVLVTPWNFPAAMATRKIGPALAAGCTVVLKPASDTPLTMLALMPILAEAGVPAGVVNVIPSRSSGTVVSAMLHDPRVRVISFTGSTEVGRKLLHEAADNVVKPAMELGGNAPFIVFDDADIDAAIEGAMIAKMRNMGEACTAANRFYVHEKVHDEFARKLTAKMGSLKMGNGLDEGVSLGPLVNKEGLDKVVELVDDAVGKGAKILTGGKATGGKGFFYPATVLANVPDNAKMLNEEIFGPVASLQTFKSEDEVIRRANDTEYGLVAYLYTKDLSRGMRVSEKLDFGMIGLNRGLVSDPGRAIRRHEAIRHRPRGRARRADGVPRDAIRFGVVVSEPVLPNSDVARRFVGAWRYVGATVDGKPDVARGTNPKGLIVYDPSGHMAVHVTPEKPTKSAGGELTPATPRRRWLAWWPISAPIRLMSAPVP
jgi:succinate-semialdehyde dehydrogenase/glutarate-semialdehyde dehydrogenase